jgi:excisionase family DNA binding protein
MPSNAELARSKPGSLPRFYSPASFAELTGMSLSTVRRYLAQGKLPKFQPGGPNAKVLIPAAAIEFYLQPKRAINVSESDTTSPTDSRASACKPHKLNSGPSPRWRRRQ